MSSRVAVLLQQLLPALKRNNVQPVQPRPPFNLRVKGATTGNAVSWETVPGADGYELQASSNGDFSTAPLISSGAATAYTDVVGSGTKKWYRVRSTSGTPSQPNLIKGNWSAPVISTSNSGTTSYDQTTHLWGTARPSAINVRRILA